MSVQLDLERRHTGTRFRLFPQAPYVTPFNEAMRSPLLPPGWDLTDPATVATLAGEISRQAGMIAYINSFALITVAALFIIPLGYLLANPGWRRAR